MKKVGKMKFEVGDIVRVLHRDNYSGVVTKHHIFSDGSDVYFVDIDYIAEMGFLPYQLELKEKFKKPVSTWLEHIEIDPYGEENWR